MDVPDQIHKDSGRFLRIVRGKLCDRVPFSHTVGLFGDCRRTRPGLFSHSRSPLRMTTVNGHRTLLAALLATALVASRTSSAQTLPAAEAPGSYSYSQILDRYQQGGANALGALIALSDTDVALGQKMIVDAFEGSPGGDMSPVSRRLRLAALIHVEAAFELADRDPGRAYRHLRVARADLDTIAKRGRVSFVRDCWVLLIAFYQGRFELVRAHELSRAARDSAGDSAELWLADGVTEEMAWTMAHADDYHGPIAGDLKDAESAYRKALRARPDLEEARLRLGRVLTLRGDIDGGLRELDALRSIDDSAFRYLAHLFAGDAFERSGRAPAAEQRDIAAFAALPEGQSARLALAHLRHAAGARAAAAEAAGAATLDRRAGETVDPWYWYTRGLFWRAGRLLTTLRDEVRR
jgi:tetratricopeptide (TPR) repeat protein